MPSHDMFMAEITAVHVDEKYVDENGAYDFGAMDLEAFNHVKYYRLAAEQTGFFGFSVMKPKTAKRKAIEKAKRKRSAKAQRRKG
jgi:ribosomal protein L5